MWIPLYISDIPCSPLRKEAGNVGWRIKIYNEKAITALHRRKVNTLIQKDGSRYGRTQQGLSRDMRGLCSSISNEGSEQDAYMRENNERCRPRRPQGPSYL
jgi:hypothetical protein